MTIDQLAIIMGKSFTALETSVQAIITRVGVLEKRMDERFDKIENIKIRDQDSKIDRLVDDMRIVKTKLGL